MRDFIFLVAGAAMVLVALLAGSLVWAGVVGPAQESLTGLGGTAGSALSLLGLWVVLIPIYIFVSSL